MNQSRGVREVDTTAERVIVVVVVAVVLVLASLALVRGVHMTEDGAVYQSGAQHLADGRGYLDFTGRAIAVFPPGAPALLAGAIGLGASPDLAWALLDLAALALYMVATWALLRRVVSARAVRLTLFTVVAFVATGTGLFDFALSDPLFAGLAALFVLVSTRLVDDVEARGTVGFVMVGLVASLCFAVRYAGAFYIFAAVVLAAVLARRVVPVLLTLVSAVAVPAIIVVRNEAATGTPTGERLPSAFGPLANARDAVRVGVRWFALSPVPGVVALLGMAAASVALVLLASRSAVRRPIAMWLGFLAAGFTLFMIGAASAAPLNPLDERLLLPTLTPLAAFTGCLVDQPAGLTRRRADRRRAGWVMAGGAAVLAAGAGLVASIQMATKDQTTIFTDPEIEQAIAGLNVDAPILSNAPYLVWFHTGRDVAWTPAEDAYRSTAHPAELPRFFEFRQCSGPVTVVWVNAAGQGTLYPLDALGLTPVSSDGVLEVERGGGTRSEPCVDPRSFGQGTALR